jgi:hypothetical protein
MIEKCLRDLLADQFHGLVQEAMARLNNQVLQKSCSEFVNHQATLVSENNN